MSDTDLDNGPASLAQIAGMDYSDVAEIRGGSLPAMMGIFDCKSAILGERETDDGTKYGIQFRFEVVEVEACMDRDVDPESLVGRAHMEFRNIDLSDISKSVGYAKGFVSDLGVDSSGPMGGVPTEQQTEDYVPGFLERCVDIRIRAKIEPYKDKQGNARVRFVPKVTGKK